jgi:hypothetical protein
MKRCSPPKGEHDDPSEIVVCWVDVVYDDIRLLDWFWLARTTMITATANTKTIMTATMIFVPIALLSIDAARPVRMYFQEDRSFCN